MLDAYTVRKAVPRILIAAIGINLSIYLCIAAIDITNIVGRGLGQLITQPFLQPDTFRDIGIDSNTTNNSIAIGGAIVAALITGGAIFSPAVAAGVGTVAGISGLALIGVLIPLMISIALITLAILFTLIIRQGLLIFLTIISPVAIALFVLPGTEKYFKSWYDLYLKTLLVYPIIAAIFAVSTAMAAILLGTAGDSPGAIGITKILAAMFVIFAPLVLIPFAFKLAGGAISAVLNASTGRSRTIAGNASKRFDNWRRDPNSVAGKYNEKLANQRVNTGLTGNQLWARRPGGRNRGSRIQAARSYDQKSRRAALGDTLRFKFYNQDSDVMDSLIMNEQEVAESRHSLRAQLEANQMLVNSGQITQREADDRRYAIERALQAHDTADEIGRTTAARQAAFLSADRIKFTSNNHTQEIAKAREIFGAGAPEAMNEHQAIAKGPSGRPDLSASLYSQETYDLDRAFGSQSTYTLMNNGRPAAVESFIQQNLEILNSGQPERLVTESDSQYANKVQSWRDQRVTALTRLESISNGKSGGTDANLQKVRQYNSQIKEQIEAYTTFRAREIIQSGRTTDESVARSLAKQEVADNSLGYSSDPELRHRREEEEKK